MVPIIQKLTPSIYSRRGLRQPYLTWFVGANLAMYDVGDE